MKASGDTHTHTLPISSGLLCMRDRLDTYCMYVYVCFLCAEKYQPLPPRANSFCWVYSMLSAHCLRCKNNCNVKLFSRRAVCLTSSNITVVCIKRDNQKLLVILGPKNWPHRFHCNGCRKHFGSKNVCRLRLLTAWQFDT